MQYLVLANSQLLPCSVLAKVGKGFGPRGVTCDSHVGSSADKARWKLRGQGLSTTAKMRGQKEALNHMKNA